MGRKTGQPLTSVAAGRFLGASCLLVAIAACSSGDGDLLLDDTGLLQQDSAQPQDAIGDFAAPLYNAGGQWWCSVTSAGFAVDDQIVFHADGSAEFQRYGTVYWNRDLVNLRLTIHRATGLPFAMHGIFASSQSLQFNVDLALQDDAHSDEVYACVSTDS